MTLLGVDASPNQPATLSPTLTAPWRFLGNIMLGLYSLGVVHCFAIACAAIMGRSAKDGFRFPQPPAKQVQRIGICLGAVHTVLVLTLWVPLFPLAQRLTFIRCLTYSLAAIFVVLIGLVIVGAALAGLWKICRRALGRL